MDLEPARAAPVWALLPLLVLVGAWLLPALRDDIAGDPRQWLPAGVAVALTALVTAALAAYPRRPRQLSLVVLALVASYVLWDAALRLGGPGPADAAGGAPAARLLVAGDVVSLLLLGLALAYLTDARARRTIRYLLVAAGLVLVLAVMGRLWQHHDPSSLFSAGRLSYPGGDPEEAAALLGLLFLPLVWVAADTRERVLLRAVSLAAAATLAQLGVLTRSWTALAAFGGALVLTFVLSPARLRTLFYLTPAALLLVRSLPVLLNYADQGPATIGAWPATYAALITLVVATIIGLALALLESWVDVSRRMRVWFGTVTVGLAVAGLALGATRLPSDAADTAASWWADTARPHDWSAWLLHLPTAILALAIAAGVAGILWQRGASAWSRLVASRRKRSQSDQPETSERRPEDAWTIALLAAVTYWGLHATLAWTWGTPFTALPALLLFAIAVAEVDARAGVLWPGWSARVRRAGARLWGTVPPPSAAGPEDRPVPGDAKAAGVSEGQQPFTTLRRTDQYERRRRRRARRERTLRPPGPLSAVYRWLVLIASAIGVVWLTWVYFTIG